MLSLCSRSMSRFCTYLIISVFVFVMSLTLLATPFSYEKKVISGSSTSDSVTEEHFFLKSSSADFLSKHYSAILHWKNRLGETSTPLFDITGQQIQVPYQVPYQVDSQNGRSDWFEMDLENVLPQKIKNWNLCFTEVCHDGPNCWNCALSSNNILDAYHYIDGDLFYALLNSKLCRERKMDEALESGDIIALRNRWGEIHGAVYLTDEMVFTKNGYSKMSNFRFQNIGDMFNVYGLNDDYCKRRPVGEVDPEEKCYMYANYYSCQAEDMNKYLHYFSTQWDQLQKFSYTIGQFSMFNKPSFDITESYKSLNSIGDELQGKRDSDLANAKNAEEQSRIKEEYSLVSSLKNSLISALDTL